MRVPLLKLAYLLILAVGLFFLRDAATLAAIAGAQLILWALWRVHPRFLLRLARRLVFFLAVVTIVYGASNTRGGGESDWRALILGLQVNVAGLWMALAMGLRVVALVLASTWVQRSGEPGDFGRAMIQARVPKRLAWSIDATLTLLTAEGIGGGGGGGGGGKKGKKPFTLAQLRRGDFGFLTGLLQRGFSRAGETIRRNHPDMDSVLTRDLTLVTGISLAAMGLKMIQVMPGLPVAPGQKNLILIPFFLLAADQTRTRMGGLWCSATVGLLSFFLGFGKWGIFELGHFLVPGLLADLLLPLVRGRGLVRVVQLCLLGALLGLGRFTANVLVLVLAGGDLFLFVVYAPMALSQVIFGTLSGLVSAFLLGAGERLFSEAEIVDDRSSGGGGGSGGGTGGGRGRGFDATDPARSDSNNPDFN